MTVNVTDLRTKLSTRLQALTGAEDSEDVLALTVALTNLSSNRFMSVTNYADLPNLTTFPMPSGSLVFVEQFNTMMMSVGTQWRGVDGRVPAPLLIAYAWGYNGNGRLGDNTTSGRSSPITVVGGITSWSQVSAGYHHNLGITSTGIAYAWGRNNFGQLGDNTTTSRRSPVSVVGGITNWTRVSAGSFHSLGITSAGIAYAWGYNGQGALGDNTSSSRLSPITVVGGITNWSQVSAGSLHSLGLTSTGITYAWGLNSSGELGDDTVSNRSSPITVVGGITSWSQVSAGYQHNLGITSTGIAYAWGLNNYSQLGDNTTSNRSSPVSVVGGISNWSKVSAGKNHNLGLTSTSIAYAWGNNVSGRLGDNTSSNRASPVTVVGGITNWSQVSAGRYHSLGLASTGIAYGWGRNSNGQLGDGTTSSRLSPVTVIGGLTNWNQVSAGGLHSLALKVG